MTLFSYINTPFLFLKDNPWSLHFSGLSVVLVQLLKGPMPLYASRCYNYFLYKNLFYKNVEPGIGQTFKNLLRTYPG